VYLESHQGENTIIQSKRIKEIYTDFEADYIVLDLQQAGIAIYEQLGLVTKDEERGIEYEAYTVYEHKSLEKSLIDELKEKTLSIKAKPIIYPIMANAKLNSEIAVVFRDKLQRNMINILVNDNEAEMYLTKNNKEYKSSEDVNLKSWYIMPYIETQLMVNESVALEYSVVNGNIKLETVGTARKDRYTSCSYGNFFASLLEKDLIKPKGQNNLDITKLFNFRQPQIRKR
jgi:hypothetical protein